MSEQIVDAAEQRPVQFCGLFRSDEHGVVRVREAALIGAMLRNGFKKDYGRGIPEGTLAHYVGKNLTDDAWKVALQRLVNWKWAELHAGYRGGGVRVKLTEMGKYHAVQLCCERQRAGKSPDGIEA